MEEDNPLSGMYALTALRLCQMGCIGPHLPFNNAIIKSMIFQNPVLSNIGVFESKFLIVLANCIEIAHPRNQSVWVICEAAGEFMRQLDDPEQRESIVSIITHDHMAKDKQKMEEEEIDVEKMTEDDYMPEEDMAEDGFLSEEEDMVDDEETRRDEKQELIDTILVRIPKMK
jgi:hypothetical protein